MALAPQSPAYRAPRLFQALRVLDLLEFTGSAVQAAELLQLSQSSVVRHSRRMTAELGLELGPPSDPQGLSCGDGACLRLLRRAAKRHRLDAGVARIAADGWLSGALQDLNPVLPLPARFRPLRQWHALVRSHVLDGALVWGQDLRQQIPELSAQQELRSGLFWDGCVLVPVGAMPLQLVRAQHQPRCRPGMPRWSGVLLPPLPCCPAITSLVQQQQRQPLHLCSGHNNPVTWAESLRGNPVDALVSPGWRRQLEATGLALQPVPFAPGITAEVWLLVHRRDWTRQPQLTELAGLIGDQLNRGPVSCDPLIHQPDKLSAMQ